VAAAQDTLCHGVRHDVGRSLRVLEPPVAGPTVLFYVSEDEHGSDEVERLIRTAGFEPMRIAGIERSSRLEVGGDLHNPVVGSAEAAMIIARIA
jgi:predicted dinucleotide-binding enzyme